MHAAHLSSLLRIKGKWQACLSTPLSWDYNLVLSDIIALCTVLQELEGLQGKRRILERLVPEETQGRLGSRVPQAPLGLQEKREQEATRDRKEILDLKEIQEPAASKV